MSLSQMHSVLDHLRRTVAGAEPAADAQLLERFVAARDESAFELLVWRHARLVLGVCRRVLRHEADAEDAFQATFLVLARRARSITRGVALAGWLARVAHRVALRARTRRPVTAELSAADLAHDPATSDPAAAAGLRELRAVLDHELNLLPARYRLPLVLCHLEGRSLDEAAREIGCPRSTLGVRLLRGRDLLRRRLVRRGVVLSVACLTAGLCGETGEASAGLLCETVKAGLLYAAAGPAVNVPTQAVALAEGVLRTMFLTKLKGTVAGVMLAVLVLAGVGAGVISQLPARAQAPSDPGLLGAGAPAEKPPAPPQPKPPFDPPPPAPADPPEAVMRQWKKHADAVESLVMDFELVQGQQGEKKGTMKYLRPDRFMLALRGPGPDAVEEVLIVDGETALEMLPRHKQAVRQRLPRGEDYWLVLLLGFKPDALAKRFDLHVAKEDRWYVYVTIAPRTDVDRDRIRQARLVLNKETWLPRQLWIEASGANTVTWDILKADPKTPTKAEDFRIPELSAGWKVVERPVPEPRPSPPGDAPGSGPKRDVLDDLVADLVKTQRGDEQAVEALYLAALARFPSESEKKVLAAHLARQKDRREALTELVRQLTETQEFRHKVHSLTERGKRGP
jgi:RNA polymerase sigma factor (sigma-70 family)